MHHSSIVSANPDADDPSAARQEQEKKSRLRGLEAHKANIMAAKSVARLMRSSMGPKGMDKMMQSPDGDILISERCCVLGADRLECSTNIPWQAAAHGTCATQGRHEIVAAALH